MSKIQDALQKMRPKPIKLAGVVDSETPTVNLRQLKEPNELDESQRKALRNPKYLVEIDSDALRKGGYLAPEFQERQVAEQYRILKRPLLKNVTTSASRGEGPSNLIMVASALPADGKTFNCINLALSMAWEKDVTVLLVDADIARPYASELFGINERRGLTDLLTDTSLLVEDLVLDTNVQGLKLLPAGHPDPHATELLASNRMEQVVLELSEGDKNRVVLFDSPPVLVTSESRVLSSYMDQIVLVVCAGKTPQQAVLDALDNLDSSKAVNLILNQAADNFSSGGYGAYQYGYGMGVTTDKE